MSNKSGPSHRAGPALKPYLKLLPRPSIIPDPPIQYKPPKRNAPEFNELSACHYTEQVYQCCRLPYTTTVPPQVRHLSTCTHAAQVLSSNIQPNLICAILHKSPIPMEILATCDPCIEIEEARCPFPRADWHGKEQVGLDGEWVLVFAGNGNVGYGEEDAGAGEVGEANGNGGDGNNTAKDKKIIKEGWVRLQSKNKKLWREWGTKKRGGFETEMESKQIVVVSDGEEWIVLR